MGRFNVVISVKIISGVGRAEPICCQGCAYNGSIVAKDALVIGIAVERVPGDKTVGGDVGGDLGGKADAKEQGEGEQEAAHGSVVAGAVVEQGIQRVHLLLQSDDQGVLEVELALLEEVAG